MIIVPPEHLQIAAAAMMLVAKKLLLELVDERGLGPWITDLHEQLARLFKNLETDGAAAYQVEHIEVFVKTLDDFFREILRHFPDGEALLRKDCQRP